MTHSSAKAGKLAYCVAIVARLGYLAEGVIYGLLGVLTAVATFTAAKHGGVRDAIAAVNAAPFGRLLLLLIAVGLLCHAIWRFVQAVWDTEEKGRSAKGTIIRCGYAFGGVVRLALAFVAGAAAVRGVPATGQGDLNQERAAWLLSWPGGWVVLAVAGLVVVGVGLSHLRLAYRADFMQDYEHASMSGTERRWVRPIGRSGIAARGLIFCLVGMFLTVAGWRTNAGTVRNVGEAFTVIAARPWGQLWLTLIATGLIAYGIYCLSLARYRRLGV